jgi:hypothetical protein
VPDAADRRLGKRQRRRRQRVRGRQSGKGAGDGALRRGEHGLNPAAREGLKGTLAAELAVVRRRNRNRRSGSSPRTAKRRGGAGQGVAVGPRRFARPDSEFRRRGNCRGKHRRLKALVTACAPIIWPE